MPIRPSDFVFETGAATTDASGEATITLSCFKSSETPCVILSGFGATGNANANITDLFLVGSTWTAKIITSAPNITVHYRAINATAGDAEFSPDSISGLIIDLDARDVAVGAITSWTDRKNNYTLTGNATRDSQMNGYPSVTFNGTSDRLYTTSNAITQINGSTATTTVVVMKNTLTASNSQGFVCGLSNSSVTLLSNIWAAGPFQVQQEPSAVIINQSYGNVGSNFRYFASNNASPGVLSCVVDFNEAGASEASTIRYNGQVPSILVPPGPYSLDNTGTFPSMDVLLGSWNSGTFPWPGSITKMLIYNRRLTTAEMLYLERGIARLGGIGL